MPMALAQTAVAPEKPLTKQLILQYLPPDFIAILTCESNLQQFDRKGRPLLSDTSDVGIGQINRIHWGEAKELGLDIFNSEEDNLKMAKIIYESEGVHAWTCSKIVEG